MLVPAKSSKSSQFGTCDFFSKQSDWRILVYQARAYRPLPITPPCESAIASCTLAQDLRLMPIWTIFHNWIFESNFPFCRIRLLRFLLCRHVAAFSAIKATSYALVRHIRKLPSNFYHPEPFENQKSLCACWLLQGLFSSAEPLVTARVIDITEVADLAFRDFCKAWTCLGPRPIHTHDRDANLVSVPGYAW